ncbi:MAG TPA: PilN domain-containing protein [Burkholderiales bacterium]|nr:PilN domain-containing protein [Burkholderiales bacterium]
MDSIAGLLQSSKGRAGTFLAWWRDELWGLVPEAVRIHLASGARSVVVASAPTGLQVFEEAGGRAKPASPVLALDEAAAAALRIRRQSSPARLGVRIAVQSCFKRSVELPAAARADAGRILDLDLERSTPFKLKDVYTAAYVDANLGPAGRIRAVQLIAKRGTIDPILEELRAAGLEVDFVDCWDEQANAALPVNFLAAGAPQRSDWRRVVTAPRLLAGLAALLVIALPALMLWRYQSALEDVQARVAETRTRATAVRAALQSSNAAVAELTRLQRLKLAQVPSIAILEELSRLLPDSVFIADLRLEGTALDITGLAKSGASLLPLFERSKMFAEPALTAPLTFDQQEDKERFSLRVRLRQVAGEERSAGTEEQH